MKPIKSFTVSPILPQKLSRLKDIAVNLWWSYNVEARELFRQLDMDLWEETSHNPVLLLSRIRQEVLDERANDESYLYQLQRVAEYFDHSMNKTTWYQNETRFNQNLSIAYFSMEYGITESLSVYSGGLGVLSGDHLKSSSELGIPLHAIGLSYQSGYFQQDITIDDWQEEKYVINDFYNMPLTLQIEDNGQETRIAIPFPGRTVYARIWIARIGKVPLRLLDTNIRENSEADRKITAELYGGDREKRIQQEIILGMGGIKALQLCGNSPCICHMNEGHSAFSGLERIKNIIRKSGKPFYEALELVKASSVFTTHTPVKAGIDIFHPDLIKKYFADYVKEVGIGMDELLGLGRINPGDAKEEFSMAVLAIRLSNSTNGVSTLHGEVSRKMWRSMWPGVLTEEIPITSVTNGIHYGSWVSGEMASLFDRYLGPQWHREPADFSVWGNVHKVPDGELWRTHERRRERLVGFARSTVQAQHKRWGKSQTDLERARNVLNTEALTIGFARRFATYKRATLIFSDPERLARILSNRDYPVQIIFAGKAHPQDQDGKHFIREILQLAHQESFYQSVVFLENYNMNIARYLVQGCDLWLNNPRRGLEACGTSGMKAAANGALNFSTLDGWWDEIYNPDLGWAIGDRKSYDDENYWDKRDADTLYNILENEIIPAFYKRDQDGLPRSWIRKMKNSMTQICPIYNTHRMLRDYMVEMYNPAAERSLKLSGDNLKLASELANWKYKMRLHWKQIRFIRVESGTTDGLSVTSKLQIKAEIGLGEIRPDDVELQILFGRLDSDGHIRDGELETMQVVNSESSPNYLYEGEISGWESGLNGFTLRIIPCHPALANPFEDGLISWHAA